MSPRVLVLAVIVLPLGMSSQTVPPLWQEAPASLNDYTTVGNKTVIDAWNYTHRLGMYKLLLGATYEVMKPLGANNEGNILWGLALQHGWQYSSGRLRTFDSKQTNCPHQEEESIQGELCISVSSWWAVMNFGFSVIPFMGALSAGFFSDWPYEITLLKPIFKMDDDLIHDFPPLQDFCSTREECLNGIHAEETRAWRDFFIFLRGLDSHVANLSVPDRLGDYEEEMLGRMWHAHVLSGVGCGLRARPLLRLLPTPEAEFGAGWLEMVRLTAAARWPTQHGPVTRKQENIMPKRVLTEKDQPLFIPDFTWWENLGVTMITGIPKLDKITGGAVFSLWTFAMCSPEGRSSGRRILDFLEEPFEATIAMASLLWGMVFHPC